MTSQLFVPYMSKHVKVRRRCHESRGVRTGRGEWTLMAIIALAGNKRSLTVDPLCGCHDHLGRDANSPPLRAHCETALASSKMRVLL